MGFDKLVNFLIKNLNNDIIENINIITNIHKIIVNHIIFDISFIIYHILIELEDEINNIIKIILSLPFNCIDENTIENKLYSYFSKPYWKNNLIDIETIFDGFNEDEIVNNFINYIYSNSIIDKILIEKIFIKLNTLINNIHYMDLIYSINIIFDGIPSYSKILEQRRRRVKNYIESLEKKNKFENYFKDIENTFDNTVNTYDYFKWLKYRFTIDKSFGPSSIIISNLEIYLYNEFSKLYPKIKININSAKNNGEADYKMFKDIYNNNYLGDIIIHTIDSDLIHQIMIQQNYFNIIKKDINLSVIRYNYKNNNNIQLLEAQIINKQILKIYSEINNIQTIDYHIIYDLALIFYFFGNDYFPTSFEIGSDLSLEFLCKSHKNALNTSTIIKLIKNKITINYDNLKLYLIEINKNNSINKTKIILGKYFKINNQITSLLTDKLKLNFNEIILLCKKILFDDFKNHKDLDKDDLRYKLNEKYKNIDFNIKNINKTDILKILSILDISALEEEYCGLPLYIRPFYINNEYDNYKNLYINLMEQINNSLINTHPIIYDYISLESVINNNYIISTNKINDNVNSFLKKIYHLVTSLFGDMSDYNSNNMIYYNGYTIPPLSDICNYIENNKIFYDLSNDFVDEKNYFNSINHHILITPFIKLILWKFKSPDLIFIIENLNNIDNLWYNQNEDFLFKDFDINNFNNQWLNTLFKLSLSKKTISPEILHESESYLLNF